MNFKLENDNLTVEVAAKGAEIQSVVCDGIERIWSADPSVWGRRAPLLFPIIGRLMNGSYEYEGKAIAAPMHGFCRNRAFDGFHISQTEVRFTTESDEETRKVFPFDFRLEVEFSLEGNTLRKVHIIENTGERPMPFEVGGHEAYATRLLPGETMADYFVQFQDCDSIEIFGMDKDGMLALPKTRVELEDGRLVKTPEQLNIDTLIMEHVPGRSVSLECTKNPYKTTVDMGDFPYLGIWTIAGQKDPGYICIEPWSALPDGFFIPRELGDRPGVITLSPGEATTLAYTMTFE